MEYYSAISKKERMPLEATWMDLKSIILKKPKKDKYHMTSLICVILKKMMQMNLFTDYCTQQGSHSHTKENSKALPTSKS